MVEVVRTKFAPFSQILKIFSRIGALIVAPPRNSFQICSIRWKGFFFPEKNAANVI